MRFAIYVKPGSKSGRIGGTFDGELVVRVTANAEDGRATEAALKGLAAAFGISRKSVSLVSGASSRRKIVEIESGPAESETLMRRHGELLADR